MTTCEKADYNAMMMVSKQLSKIIDVESPFSISEGRFEKLISKRVPVVFREYAKDFACVKRWNDPNTVRQLAEDEFRSLNHRKY